MLIGYVRVSTLDQYSRMQEDALKQITLLLLTDFIHRLSLATPGLTAHGSTLLPPF